MTGFHHETVEKFLQSVLDGCGFCRVLYDQFEEGQVEERSWYGRDHKGAECYLKYKYLPKRSFLLFEQAAWMRQTQVEAESPKIRIFSFRLYANEGVSCCCSLELNWKEPVLC
jgi:hypothetical protein